MTNQTQVSVNTYNDVFTIGQAYATNLRMVKPDKSQGQRFKPYRCVTLHALSGHRSNPSEVFIDCTVVGEKAKIWFDEHVDACDNTVLYDFSIGDISDELFQYKSGEKEGEHNVAIRGRLLGLAKHEGELETYTIKTNGKSYLNIRKFSETNEAVSVTLVSGEKGDPAYTNVDCELLNQEASNMVSALRPYALEGKKVVAYVDLEGIGKKKYPRKNGEEGSEWGSSLTSSISGIRAAYVDGDRFDFETNSLIPAEQKATGTNG